MEKKFDRVLCSMSKIKTEIEEKLSKSKGNKSMEEIYKNQLKIVNRCINTLYL